MMHDRFSAQLRQHLLATADERPAVGQAAAIAERVAVTAQRHPVAARLIWFPGRVGPVPSAAVRYGLIAAALLALLWGMAILGGAGGSGPAPTAFEGRWTSTDPADDSTLTLIIGAGTRPSVRFEDDFAAGAACVEDTVKRFTADGDGAISGNRLEVAFPDGGGCLLMKVPMVGVYYDYDEDTDTLLDQDLLRWVRFQEVGGGLQPSATDSPPPPATEGPTPPETDAPLPATEMPTSAPSAAPSVEVETSARSAAPSAAPSVEVETSARSAAPSAEVGTPSP